MKNIFEEIAVYTFWKILDYIMKKYNLKDYFEVLTHIQNKQSQNKPVSKSTSTLAPTKTIVEPPREPKESQK